MMVETSPTSAKKSASNFIFCLLRPRIILTFLAYPKAICVYTHTQTSHLFWTHASTVYAIVTGSVHVKWRLTVEVGFAALALVTSSGQ
jgi:hypothetical protein